MAGKKDTNKVKVAQTIYMAGNYNLDEIAELMGVSPKTVHLWSKEGNWAKLRASNAITPQRLLDDLYIMVNQICEGMTEKRYEHFTANGKQFTKWFPFTGKDRPKWQVTGKLKNEYRDAVRNNIRTGS